MHSDCNLEMNFHHGWYAVTKLYGDITCWPVMFWLFGLYKQCCWHWIWYCCTGFFLHVSRVHIWFTLIFLCFMNLFTQYRQHLYEGVGKIYFVIKFCMRAPRNTEWHSYYYINWNPEVARRHTCSAAPLGPR